MLFLIFHSTYPCLFSPLFSRAKTSGCRCTRSWWKSPTSSTQWVACQSAPLSVLIGVLAHQSWPEPETRRTSALSLPTADALSPLRIKRLVSPCPSGCVRTISGSLFPLWASPSVCRGDYLCTWLLLSALSGLRLSCSNTPLLMLNVLTRADNNCHSICVSMPYCLFPADSPYGGRGARVMGAEMCSENNWVQHSCLLTRFMKLSDHVL